MDVKWEDEGKKVEDNLGNQEGKKKSEIVTKNVLANLFEQVGDMTEKKFSRT
jgi:hypothetical protein